MVCKKTFSSTFHKYYETEQNASDYMEQLTNKIMQDSRLKASTRLCQHSTFNATKVTVELMQPEGKYDLPLEIR
jgi:hypothetical protein